MKKNMRVIQISGLRGILLVAFFAICFCAGFVVFPAIVAMSAWNYVAHYIAIPTINIAQGLMLWAIVAVSGFIMNNRKRYLFSFIPENRLSDQEVQRILENVKTQNKVMPNQVIKQSENSEKEEKENV